MGIHFGIPLAGKAHATDCRRYFHHPLLSEKNTGS
mgnify:FL=1